MKNEKKSLKTISLKIVIIFLAMYSLMIAGIIVISFFLMKNLDFQYIISVKLGLYSIMLAFIVGGVIYYAYSKPIDNKIKKIDNLSKSEFKKLVKKATLLPIYSIFIMSFVMIISYGVYYILLRNNGFNQLSSLSVLVPLIAGIIAVGQLSYFIMNFYLRDTLSGLSEFATSRKLTFDPPKISYRFKLYYIFSASVIGVILWYVGFAYYFNINNTIDRKVDNYLFFQKNIVKRIPEEIKNTENSDEIIQYFSDLAFEKNGIVMIADKTGKLIYKSDDKKLYVEHFKKINNKIKDDLKTRTSNSFYENENGNIICYTPINDEYSLIFVSNVNTIIGGMSGFLLWVLIFASIGLLILGVNSYIFSESIISSLKYVANRLNLLSKGDLTKTAYHNSSDETMIMINSYNELNKSMNNIIVQIKSNSENLNSAAFSLSSSSQQIAENANEQASTTEEISSSMEEMLATVNSNTEKSENTNEISSNAAQTMEKNKDMILQTLDSINKISDKISIISEISAKTDILSINAAIEAARAGDAGRGFAVVAQEIRKLADTTQNAAKEIEELSRTNQNISHISSKELEKIIPEIIRSAELVNDIVIGSKEQQTNIESINNAVLQLTDSTNKNSASAEEMASSAEQLTAQAEQLKEMVSVFKIDKNQLK